MNCNLNSTDRDSGKKCKSFKCRPCREYSMSIAYSRVSEKCAILKKAVELLSTDDVHFMLDGDVIKIAKQALKDIEDVK